MIYTNNAYSTIKIASSIITKYNSLNINELTNTKVIGIFSKYNNITLYNLTIKDMNLTLKNTFIFIKEFNRIHFDKLNI